MKELSERKVKIVCALVDCYINTGEPVSSSDIRDKYLPEVSSATVRSELSALEALGYIDQPHTSSGRVPLKDAYKLYVNNEALNKKTPAKVNGQLSVATFTDKLEQVEDLSKEVAKIISDATNYTSFVVKNMDDGIVIEEVKLVPLKQNKLIIVIATNHGILSDSIMNFEAAINQQVIDIASKVINNVFAGKEIKSIEDIDCKIESEIGGVKEIFRGVLEMISNYIKEKSAPLFVEGQYKMLDNNEYKDLSEAKKFLQVVSDKDTLSEVLPAVVSETSNDIEFSIKIGSEDNGLKNCAIISAAYKVGDKVLGQAGVIGPERMNYKKVINVLKGLKTTLNILDKDKQDRSKVKQEIRTWLKDNKTK